MKAIPSSQEIETVRMPQYLLSVSDEVHANVHIQSRTTISIPLEVVLIANRNVRSIYCNVRYVSRENCSKEGVTLPNTSKSKSFEISQIGVSVLHIHTNDQSADFVAQNEGNIRLGNNSRGSSLLCILWVDSS